jgi:hypothetical protein
MSIQRVDSDTTHGWQARVYVCQGRPRLTMLCSDADYGGSEQAHKAAGAALKLLQLKALMQRRRMALAGLQNLVKGARR